LQEYQFSFLSTRRRILNPKTNPHFIVIVVITAILGGLFSGFTPGNGTMPSFALLALTAPAQMETPTAIHTLTPSIPIPKIVLNEGDSYFSIDGRQGYIFMRNLAGNEPSQYLQQLDLTTLGGSKLVRLQLDSFGMGYSNTGQLDEAWAKKCEAIFDMAASRGIYVMPVFSAWYDWNDGKGYSTWVANPINAINGGRAITSRELFSPNSPSQIIWLGWMKTLIDRWQNRENIIAWEIFSEINMVPGSTETEGTEFIKDAALIIRTADSSHRPITASLADFGDWSKFYRSDAIDFISIHPYPVSGKLDSAIITETRSMMEKYNKPVLIGESGLSFETPDTKPATLTTADRADIGIKHAIWAAVVSGAMNGRSLWWEDGVAIYFPNLNLPFIIKYAEAELPAANFVKDIDFTNFQPLYSTTDPGLMGAAIGNEKLVLGWYRDAASEPPDWKETPNLSNQKITLTLPAVASTWTVDFYDTKTGKDITSSAIVNQKGKKVTITLPDFSGDIAFKMQGQK
jgi:hypothetical protein